MVKQLAGFPQTWKAWKSQGIAPKVRELFEAGLSSKAFHPRLLKWTWLVGWTENGLPHGMNGISDEDDI